MSEDVCIATHYGRQEGPLRVTPTEPPYMLMEMASMDDVVEWPMIDGAASAAPEEDDDGAG